MNHLGKPPILVLNTRCQQYLEPLKDDLAEAGYWTFQSFDLQSTRALHDEGCTCPHHGTNQCTCEMVVLLVYSPSGDPVTLMLDGRDNQTFLYMMEEPDNLHPASTLDGITQVLLHTAYQLLIGSYRQISED